MSDEQVVIGRDEALLWVDLPAQPESVAQARRRVASLPDLPVRHVPDLQLIVSELATNALRHSDLEPEDIFRLTISRQASRLRVDVDDGGTFIGSSDERLFSFGIRGGGFGLRIIEAVSLRWQAEEGRVSVWIDI